MVVLGLLLLPGAIAFALDGVLIGAGDVRFLGRAMVIALAIYLPFAALPLAWPALGIVGVWSALALWMVARAVLMNRRFRGVAWLG
jgi:Na+-driven multidrug efflux pump